MQGSHAGIKKVTVLDCTLRDGGYCNNWQFDKKTAQAAIASLNGSGVDIVEIGYKSPRIHREKTFEGLFRFCTESQLNFLKKTDRVKYAFMIDAKEFLHGDKADKSLVSETIPEQQDSLFEWVRIATHAQNFSGCRELISAFRNSGYKVTLNLMGVSLLTHDELSHAIQQYAKAEMDVLYFSDSFGDLSHADVLECVSLIRNYYHGKIGIHTHDNNGLAFANTLSAIGVGVDFIDSTIMGMGRGAGNLRTEQMLLYLYFKKGYTHLNPSELLDVINIHFVPLQQEFRWGWDYTYMLSALQNIHPTYCMNLRATNQYSIEQVSAILNGISPEKRKKFDEDALFEAIDTVVNEPMPNETPQVSLPVYASKPAEKILVIATGPSAEKYREEITEYISQHQPFVIECNPSDERFSSISERYLGAVLNWVRLKKRLEDYPGQDIPLVTGIPNIPKQYAGVSRLSTLPCHVGLNEVSITTTRFTLPAYVVGMFSVSLALLSAPETVYLAGFDGYKNGANPQQLEMNLFWEKISGKSRLQSITPTTYALVTEPVYKLIK